MSIIDKAKFLVTLNSRSSKKLHIYIHAYSLYLFVPIGIISENTPPGALQKPNTHLGTNHTCQFNNYVHKCSYFYYCK